MSKRLAATAIGDRGNERTAHQQDGARDTRRDQGVGKPQQMVLTLEREGFIRRQPGVARSIEMLIDPECLPVLR
jgi:hypothetical protein